LIVPGASLLLWFWKVARWRRDARQFWKRRKLPVREQFGMFGAFLFWFCLILATTFTILALAQPRAAVSFMRTAGVDLVILQDGSASMYTRDVSPDRWQRSMKFIRVLAESLQWKDDRIALASFAHIATPQVRLTTDPNTFFFFLDHLNRESPFPLVSDNTWDTNIEMGIYWGARLIEKDEQMNGRSPNSKIFVLISDGQAWSGKIDRALKLARSRDIPVFVVGTGTSTGGFIPEAPVNGDHMARTLSPVHARLDRASLLTIARAGNGQYYELDRESDREIATAIIDAGRSRAGSTGVQESFEDLYWRCLLAAACMFSLGMLFLRDRAELWIQLLGTTVTLCIVWTLTR
jgi:Ca-activated chloride channel family protein